MTRADIFAGLLLAAGFGAVLWEASSFLYGTEFAPGPGFAPVWLALIGIVLSLLVVFNARQVSKAGGEGSQAEPLDKRGLLRVAATLAGLVVMMIAISWLGLVTAILAFLLFLTFGVQRLSPVAALGASVATVLFVYFVFAYFLHVPIPVGPFGI